MSHRIHIASQNPKLYYTKIPKACMHAFHEYVSQNPITYLRFVDMHPHPHGIPLRRLDADMDSPPGLLERLPASLPVLGPHASLLEDGLALTIDSYEFCLGEALGLPPAAQRV